MTLWPDALGLREGGQSRVASEGSPDGPVQCAPTLDHLGGSDPTPDSWVAREGLLLWLELEDIRADRAASVKVLARQVLTGTVEDQHEMTWYKHRIFAYARDYGCASRLADVHIQRF